MKKLLPLFFLLVLSSGCTFLGGTDGAIPTDAIVVNDFSVDPPLAEYDDVVSFFLDIENVGGTTASCIVSELHGLETWCSQEERCLSDFSRLRPNGFSDIGFSGSGTSINFQFWNPSRGDFVDVSFDRPAGMPLNAFAADSWNRFSQGFCDAASQWTQFQDIKYFDSMRPAVPSEGRPGQAFNTNFS